MKILHIAQILQGGTASHMCELLAFQAREWGEGCVHVLAPEDQISYLDGLQDCTVRTFPSSGRDPASLIAFGRALARALEETRPDIIHLHGTYAGLVGRIVAAFGRSARTPIVYCSHGWSFNMQVSPSRRAIYGLIERTLAPRADAILCISHYETATARARKLPADRLLTVHNGIAITPPSPPWAPRGNSGSLPLLFAGRDCPQKGYDVLLQAMAGLTHTAIELVAVGPEPRPSDPANVRALGWKRRSDLGAFYEDCVALVMPSRWEGFGLVALEAMRQGRAVIASDVDGLPDLVVPGETGILVPPDDPDALREALAGLDAEILREMGTRARARFLERFTAERMHREIARVYRRLLPEAEETGSERQRAQPRPGSR